MTPDRLKEDRKTHVSPRGSRFVGLLGANRKLLLTKRKILWLRCRWQGEVMTEIRQSTHRWAPRGKLRKSNSQPAFSPTYLHRYSVKKKKNSTGTWVCLILIWDTVEMSGRPSEEWRLWSMWHVGRPLNWKCWCQRRSFLLSPLSSKIVCWLFTFREEVRHPICESLNLFRSLWLLYGRNLTIARGTEHWKLNINITGLCYLFWLDQIRSKKQSRTTERSAHKTSKKVWGIGLVSKIIKN